MDYVFEITFIVIILFVFSEVVASIFIVDPGHTGLIIWSAILEVITASGTFGNCIEDAAVLAASKHHHEL